MWTTLIIFCITLFLYIHIQHQYKSGEDLEIYEYDFTTAKDLQDIVHYKQPVLFPLDLPTVKHNTPVPTLQVKDVRDYEKGSEIHNDPILLPYTNAKGLLDTDTKSIFYSNQNFDYVVDNSNWMEWFDIMDNYLKPSFCIHKQYDLIYGSHKTKIPTAYHRESHVFLYLPPDTNSSHVQVKMTPWKSKSFLSTVDDYVYYESWSKQNLFDSQLDPRIRCLDFSLKPGHVLYLPPYWFYSIEFQDKQNEICKVIYTTGANYLANVKHLAKYYLQQQNIQEKWLKPLMDSSNTDTSPLTKSSVPSSTQNVHNKEITVEEISGKHAKDIQLDLDSSGNSILEKAAQDILEELRE